MKSLLLTLGHNSSAIFTDGNKVIGYEQERIDGIKSSSQFPTDAINEIIKHVGIDEIKGIPVFISHWFDNLREPLNYYDYKHVDKKMYESLESLGCNIMSHNASFTHHDAHAWSSYAFFRENLTQEKVELVTQSEVWFIVADGFGNQQEVISVYKTFLKDIVEGHKNLQLVKRITGYNNSLGLMYQYATSFTGMKENQDEYKYLGYESHLTKYFGEDKINRIQNYVKSYLENIFRFNYNSEHDFSGRLHEDYINIEELLKVKKDWHSNFTDIMNIIGVVDYSSFEARVAISYFIQGVIENCLAYIIDYHRMSNVVLSGGIFYNVKLNNSILNKIDGLFSVVPLAGDQGAAIGFYEKIIGNFPFKNLYWGYRDLPYIDRMAPKGKPVYVFEGEPDEAAAFLVDSVSQGNLTNLVYGNMEFGPRALCHTTSIFLPNAENVAKNNFINNRNEVMPMAPVMIEDNLEFFFDKKQYSRVVGSDRFMIVTYDYKIPYSKEYAGVMHKYPLSEKYSGRPQVIKKGEYLYNILKRIEEKTGSKCFVNTSYNVHGRPIAFNTMSVLHNYEYQCNNEKNILPTLIVIK